MDSGKLKATVEENPVVLTPLRHLEGYLIDLFEENCADIGDVGITPV